MAFERNDYLSWYIPRAHGSSGAINLHSSGVPSLDPATLEVPDVDPWQAAFELERSLAGWLGLPADEILFTPGATGGTLLVLLTLTGSGDHVLVESPVYEPMLRQAGRLCHVTRFHRLPSSGWRLELDSVASLMTDETSLVMITEPSNPSGTFLPREQVLALADLAASRGALLLVNEVYLGYSTAASLHREAENIVVVSSLSKLMGAYWIRLGWISAAPTLVDRLRVAHRNMSMPTAPGAAYGLAVMARADELRDRARELAGSGADVVDGWVRSTPGLGWTRPAGPGFGCVLLPEGVGDDVAFAERLHDEHGVLVVPGTHFEVPGSLRISWLQAGDGLGEGLERIGRAL
jgi:aspartate/methionine/tyrosine aminotransferase